MQRIEKHYIPQIEERILKKVIDINVDLLIAEQSLVRHKDLQSKFNAIIVNKVIYPLNSAVYGFFLQKKDGSSVESTDLFKIIFPAEVRESKWEIKKSVLGTGNEVIDDNFNKVIESSFTAIYEDLKDNLTVDVSKKSRILKIRPTLSIFKRIERID